MPSGPEFPELRKTASQNFSPPMWDSSDPLRRPAPLPKNTNPDLLPVGVVTTSPTKGSPTKSFTPSSVHRRLNSLQTQSSSNVRELSNVFNTQIGGSKTTSGAPTSPTKNDSPASKKDRDRETANVTIPPLFGGLKPKSDLGVSRMLASSGDLPISSPPPSTTLPPVASSSRTTLPISSSSPSIQTDRFASAINAGDFHILTGQLNNILNISSSLQKEMANLSRRSKDNAMDLMSLKEATNNRDEDIRKSLKDLASGLTRPSGRLALTSGTDSLDFDGALTRYGSAPDIHRSFVSDAEEVLRQSHAKRKSIGKDIQTTMENHSTDRILREMATKESQRRVTDLLEHIQSEVLSQGKTASSKFSELLRNIQSAGIGGLAPSAVVRYGDIETDQSVVLDLLEVLKTSMEERMDDLQNSLSLIGNTSPGTSSFDVSNHLKPVEDALDNHAQATEEIKTLISGLQLGTAGSTSSPILENLVAQISEISSKLESIPRNRNATSIEDGEVSSIELKDMLKTLIEMASRNETGTHKAAEVLIQKLGEISALTARTAGIPLSDGASNIDTALHPTLQEIKLMMEGLQGDIGGQEKVIEKALEIMLRELNKVTPAIETKISGLVSGPDTIASTTQASLKQDFGHIQTRINSVEGTIRDSMNVIQTQLQVITETAASGQFFTPRVEGKDGEAQSSRPYFDGSVAAVSAIGAMGKDLKHTMENLGSDINGREKVTEKAMEIILREICTINKAVGSIPLKVVDGVRDVLKYGDDMKQTMQELQADVLGREKHTEKALEIILRELQTVASNFDKAQLAIAHSQEQKSNIVGQVEKDIKFNLETIVTRSNRIADTSASIQEVVENFRDTQNEANTAAQNLTASLEASTKGHINDLHILLKSVQEQFKSTSSNTAQSIIEVAKYLDTLGEKASTSAEHADQIKKSIVTIQEGIQSSATTNKEMNNALIDRLEAMVSQLQESNTKAIETSKAPLEEELSQEKDANSKVITELKALIDSLKEGFTQSVVTTEARNSELSKQLESYCQSAREDQQQTQSDIRSVKESVLSLQSDDGTLAKILLAMKDVAQYLAKSSIEGNQDENKFAQILDSMTTKDDTLLANIQSSMLTKEDSSITDIQKSMLEISDQLRSLITSAPRNQEDGNDVTAKLETLINHSNHQAKFFSQMSLLDDIKKKVEGTSVQVSEFVTNQTSLLQATAASERHEAAEAMLAKEKALAEKSTAEATTAALKAEELNLQNSISSLRLDNEDLTKRKHQLSAELSSIETALALRREEMALLEARAESLERRMVEGVINQSRSLLLTKSTSASSKPLRRIVNPPAVGTLRSANGGSGRRIVSMNLTNTGNASLGVSESPNRTPSGSTMFQNSPGALRRAQSVRTSVHASRKTSWSVTEPTILDDTSGENKENEISNIEGFGPSSLTLSEANKDEGTPENSETSATKLEPELGLATLDDIEDNDTDRDESPDTAVVLAIHDSRGKRYPSSLSASSGRRDSISSENSQVEEID
ncbi:hypothetical protein H072_5501 [Dactylellina haptotyla CBS 200.50]|uniref:Uncharacterized protein n=1 Tax=Dactylellina haptotyla (strain CBS 200.50) TaxID=1284197 RepID=S8AHH2_DACHA|nr:hypothetical protein H072_5501 [Dactylellina haptotyla CBS 200.50]